MTKLDHRSTPRKTITSWYDSEAICLIMIVLMVYIFMFAYIGFTVTRETPAFWNHFWVPMLLMVTSGIIILSTMIRLIRRYFSRRF